MCGDYVSMCIFCFKQKTAYESRIGDWSSDVCSSDLHTAVAGARKSGFCRMRQPAQTLELEEPGIALDRVEEAKDAVQKRAVGRGLFPGDQIVAQRIQILVYLVEKIVKQIVHAAQLGSASGRERVGQEE